MADIFEKMGLPPFQDPKGFRMQGVDIDKEDDDEPNLHPEVKQALANKASEGLIKAGIKKEDPRHGDLLELELMLKIAEMQDQHPQFSEINRQMKISDVKRIYGSRAPAMIQALGLGRQAKVPVSKEQALLGFLKQKKAADVKKEDRDFKRSLLEAQAREKVRKEEKSALKEAHSPLNKRAETSIKILNSQAKELMKDALLRPSQKSRHDEKIKRLSYIRQMFEDAKLQKDPIKKSDMIKVLENKLRGE